MCKIEKKLISMAGKEVIVEDMNGLKKCIITDDTLCEVFGLEECSIVELNKKTKNQNIETKKDLENFLKENGHSNIAIEEIENQYDNIVESRDTILYSFDTDEFWKLEETDGMHVYCQKWDGSNWITHVFDEGEIRRC